jgi:uncharacterized repeat protein (TIGR04076 family)
MDPTFKRKEELALVRKLPGIGTPLQVRVIAREGDCAWGYHEVDRWAVDAEGRTTPNLCAPAADAVYKVAEAGWTADGAERQTACRCPVVEDRRALCGCPADPRRVVFGVRPAEQR